MVTRALPTPPAVRVVKVSNLENAATAPLEELGEVRTQFLRLSPERTGHPWHGDSPERLNQSEIRNCISALKDCQSERVRLWTIERKILMRLHDTEAHKHPDINLPSFQQFLVKYFDKTAAELYRKEVAAARIERALELPPGSYSIHQLKPLQRFRAFVPVGSHQAPKTEGSSHKVFRGKQDSDEYGVKPNPKGIERVKECWTIACDESGNDRPKTLHIEAAVQEMARRYPEDYGHKKTTSLLKRWKERAIAAEARVKELEQILSDRRLRSLSQK